MASESLPFPILETKLYRPPLTSDLVVRKRLLDRLTRDHHLPLILVSAPAGYGKSTLLSSWIEVCDSPTAWLSLDTEDNDPHRFISYLLAAIRTLFPGALVKSCSFAGGPLAPPISPFVNTLVNELAQLEESFVLVLDDYHLIHEKTVHDLLAGLLQHPPLNAHLVLATRRDPPFTLTGLRAGGKISEIRMQDLRFTPDETAALLRKILKSELDEATSSRLEQELEGWPAGLRLAAISLQHRRGADLRIEQLRTKNHHVMDYLADEIISNQGESVQNALLATSVLDRFCAPMCDAVLATETAKKGGLISGKGFIRHLETENLFIIPLDQQRVWYRYHHLFRQLLQNQVQERCRPEEIAAFHSRASIWLAKNGLLDEALDHALSAGDTSAATELVARNRIELANCERWHQLDSWLSRLPKTLVEKDPRLLMAQAWVNEFHGRHHEAWTALDRIEDLVSGISIEALEARTLLGEVNALRTQYLYDLAEGERAISCGELALEHLPVECSSARGFATVLLAGSLQMMGALGRACKLFHEALENRSLADNTHHGRLLYGLCFLHWMEGDLVSLRQVASRCVELAEKQKLSDSDGVANYFLGICHYQINELAEAEQHLSIVVRDPFLARGLTYAQSAFALALCHKARNMDGEARELAERIVDHSLRTNNTALLGLAKAFQAELALRFDLADQAQQWSQSFDPKPFHPMCDFYYPHLTLVKVLTAQGGMDSLQRAEDLFTRLKEFLSRTHNNCFLISVLILQAQLYDKKGDESVAVSCLSEAVSLAQQRNIIRPFLDAGPKMAGMLSLLAKRNVSVRFTGQILRAFRLDAASLATETTDAPQKAAPRGGASGWSNFQRLVSAKSFNYWPSACTTKKLQKNYSLHRIQ